MKIPCFEHDVTKEEPYYDPKAEKAFWEKNRLVIPPEVAKAFYREAKAWHDNGLTLPETLEKIAKRTGLRYSTIAKIIDAPKVARRLTNDAWFKQAQYREMRTAARVFAENANTPEWVKYASDLWDLSRRSATAFHGGVLPFSHARNLALGTNAERAIWWHMVRDAYKFASPAEIGIGRFKVPFGKGEARWAKAWEEQIKSDKYKEAVRYGVEARESDRPVGILQNLAQGWGIRAFDAIKFGRVELFHLLKDYAEGKRNYFIPPKLAEAFGIKGEPRELTDQDLRMLAREVNIATGASKMGATAAKFAGAVSFAPKLWITRRLEAYVPLRWLAKQGSMTPGERSVANLTMKRWARHMVTAAALLQVNDMINRAIGSKERVNWHDFSKPGTLWRMNWGGHILPFSPLVEVLRTPAVMLAVLLNTRRQLKGEEPESAMMEVLSRELLNALHPSIIGGLELITGRELFGVPRHHRRLPFKGVAQLVRGEEPERDPAMPGLEYILERGPIPLASAAKEIFTPALTEEGIPKAVGDQWVEALINSAVSGIAGMHSFEVSPRSAPQRTRYKRPPGTLK